MKKAQRVLRKCPWIFLVAAYLAGFPARSADDGGQDLKAAGTRLDCYLKDAAASLADRGKNDLAVVLEEGQRRWEKYRDLEMKLEMGDLDHGQPWVKEFYQARLALLINERIEDIQRAFDHPLCDASEIRVRNISNRDFKHVVVGGKEYGDIKRGDATAYRPWPLAYRTSDVSVIAYSKPLEIRRLAYAGEKALGTGKFTYFLTITDGELVINAIKD